MKMVKTHGIDVWKIKIKKYQKIQHSINITESFFFGVVDILSICTKKAVSKELNYAEFNMLYISINTHKGTYIFMWNLTGIIVITQIIIQ